MQPNLTNGSSNETSQADRKKNGQLYVQMCEPKKDKSKRYAMRHLLKGLKKGNKSTKSLAQPTNCRLSFEDELEFVERQNSINTLDLFRYASGSEKVSICVGVALMWYAASWQPISVFILAIMASLMGHYCKTTEWLRQFENSTSGASGSSSSSWLASHNESSQLPIASGGSSSTSSGGWFPNLMSEWQHQQAESDAHRKHLETDYESLSLLQPFYSVVAPIFELGASSGGSSARLGSNSDEQLESAIHDIIAHESSRFLRRSFEINGSAFLLALTQLTAFFLGVSLITRTAQRQASRIKTLYFRSCLNQEVTWFEAIDSAGGSGSSLNALVEKFEDGIGLKFALLTYFIGHVGLFAITAFYQMASLASFCIPFVLLVGVVIATLSERQANAVGEHALFAKRSLQLVEEIIAAIRTVLAFNGQHKEMARYSLSLRPVYRKSLVKHLYTALNTSLSKFSIFACFSAYCFYAMRLFPPHSWTPVDKATVLAVMRGAEVSIVNILISIPFMEALQQSRGSIARIYAAIQRPSKIDPSSPAGRRLASHWLPSISFRCVQFEYVQRSGPTQRRRSTLPFLHLDGGFGLPLSGLPETGSGLAQSQATTGTQGQHRRNSIADQLSEELEDVTGDISGGRQDKSTQQPTKQTQMSHTNLHMPVGNLSHRKSSTGLSTANTVRNLMGAELSAANSKEPILNRFSLDIEPGQSVALVGPSGSGKSTVLSLVQRLYDLTEGQLLIGGEPLQELNVSWLRNQIGCVTQEPRLFDMSIADNIRLGLAAHEENLSDRKCMERVVEAARAASAHEFIVRLPNGYNTRVGSAGLQLSGGQKQRIAIARAIIRRPKILLLDESTSALDTESEAKVAAALRRASEGRTTLIVAHRLATIRHVDRIVVMANGQVIEFGSHDQLMAAGSDGFYRQMWDSQKEIPHLRQPVEMDSPFADRRRPPFGRSSGRKWATNKSESDELNNSYQDHKERDDCEEIEDDYDDDQDDDVESRQSESSGSDHVEKVSAWQLWRFLEPNKWSSMAAIVVCLLSGLVLPMNLIAHSYLFSAFAYSEPEQLAEYLHIFGLVILSFSSLVFIVSFLQIILPGYVGEKISNKLRSKTLTSLLAKPVFYFDMDSNSAGALCDRFNSYISNIQNLAGTRMATLLEACATLTAGAFFGFGQNLRLSMFCLIFALLVLVTTIVESRILQREAKLQRRLDAKLAHLMADALSNIKTVASLNKESFFIQKFTEIIREREIGAGIWVARLRVFLTSLKFVMPAMSWSASMYYGSQMLVNGKIDLQTVFIVCPVVLFAVNDTFRALVFLPELLKARESIEALYRLNMEFSPSVLQNLTLAQQLEQQNRLHLQQLAADTCRQLSGCSSVVQPVALVPEGGFEAGDELPETNPTLALGRTKGSISFANDPVIDEQEFDGTKPPVGLVNRRLSNLAALPTYMRRKSSRLNSLVPQSSAQGRIEFRNVEFAYPNRPSVLVLDGFSLSVQPGESVALVGSSGCGKSTCAAILEKFYDYHSGRVALDGRDLRLVEPSWVRAQIGLVSQEPVLLSYTIGDNIRYGDNSRFVPMDEVVKAARTANIHDFIMSLPDQYDTQLASSAFSSSQLSGGQRQRISIARALIRNAPILIFDEATSALDSRNESIVQDALNKARRGRTSITIAHRLATVKDADKIVVLRDGKVVECGTHKQLLEATDTQGVYKTLWDQQESGTT